MSTSISHPIGARPLSLAGHLRRAVDLLLDTTTSSTYNWDNVSSCNCGVVARVILSDANGLHLNESFSRRANHFWGFPEHYTLFNRLFQKPNRNEDIPYISTWSSVVAEWCPHNPGENGLDVLVRLIEAGLEVDDITHLEYLTHPDLVDPTWTLSSPHVGDERPDGTRHFEKAANAAYYLMAWVKAIEAHHAVHPAPVTEVVEVQAVARATELATVS